MTDVATSAHDTAQGQKLSRAMIIEIMTKKFERLSDMDR